MSEDEISARDEPTFVIRTGEIPEMDLEDDEVTLPVSASTAHHTSGGVSLVWVLALGVVFCAALAGVYFGMLLPLRGEVDTLRAEMEKLEGERNEFASELARVQAEAEQAQQLKAALEGEVERAATEKEDLEREQEEMAAELAKERAAPKKRTKKKRSKKRKRR